MAIFLKWKKENIKGVVLEFGGHGWAQCNMGNQSPKSQISIFSIGQCWKFGKGFKCKIEYPQINKARPFL